jgi:N-acetylmuramoyl-L-alanine amidase
MWTWLLRLFGKGSKAGHQPSLPTSPVASTTNYTKGQTALTFPETIASTPNKAGKIKPEGVILHHSDGSYAGGVSWILSPKSKVSYHCLIARDGRRTVFADDTARCWHAGKGSWQGRGDVNSWTIGLSWEGSTYDTPLGDIAMASGIEYLVPRMRKWGIPVEMVLTHEQVSPGRKTDISAADAKKFIAKLKDALK